MFLYPGGFLQPCCNNRSYLLLKLPHPYQLPFNDFIASYLFFEILDLLLVAAMLNVLLFK